MVTAQETYSEMLKLGVRPALKRLGFRGSGANFTWPSRSTYSQLGFQKSRFSSREVVTFTINVTSADKSAWEVARQSRANFPAKPSPNTFYGTFVWQSRIGSLLPSGQDTWWTVEADADWRPIAAEVVDAVTRFVVPELQQRAGA